MNFSPLPDIPPSLLRGINEVVDIIVAYSSWFLPSRLAILAVAFILYFVFPRRTWQNLILLGLGVVFTMTVSRLYFAVMFSSTLVEWWIATTMFRTTEQKKRLFLVWTSVAMNAILFVFILLEPEYKYLEVFLGAWLNWMPPLHRWLLSATFLSGFPIFCKMTLTLDVYNKRLKESPKLIPSLIYVGLFSRSWSSSTDRARDTIPQLGASRPWSWRNTEDAFWLVLAGFLKFTLFRSLGNIPFELVGEGHGGLSLYIGTWLVTTGLFLSISGLTDVSRGLNILFGIRIAPNFDAPLLSTNIGDFWRRWNTTLCMWLYEEVFSRLNFALRHRGLLGVAIACLGTFLVSGFAHGLSLALIYSVMLQGTAIFVYFVGRNSFRKWVKSIGKPRWMPYATWFATANIFVLVNGLIIDDSISALGRRAVRLVTGPLWSASASAQPWGWIMAIVAVAAALHTIPHYRGGDSWALSLRAPARAGLAALYIGFVVFFAAY
ncbi:MAG TPA: MBOAT family O-acyltransferase [Fibrobacteria bacterium]|nr:MBOAT family O-acyltransferase [Fibrobacteria bacterium]